MVNHLVAKYLLGGHDMAMMAVGLALTIVSGIMQADAQKKAGIEGKQLADLNAANTKTAAQFKADQLKARATREEAVGIIKGNEAKERAEYAASRVAALAGASGTGVFDKNVVDAIVGFEERGDLNRRTEIYKGGAAADLSRLMAKSVTFSGMSQADALTYQGESIKRAGKRKATATLIGTAGSMFSQYSSGAGSGMFSGVSAGGGGSAPASGAGGWSGTGSPSVAVEGW
jgi:hypothetical protein